MFKKIRKKLKRFFIYIGLLKNYNKKLSNKKRIFKKYISDGKIHLKEVFESIPQQFDQLINVGDSDYILYFFDGERTKNFIVYNPKHEFFPLNLVNSISLLINHGSRDDNLNSYDKRIKKIMTTPLSLTCGESSTFVHQILNRLNLKSRIVLTLTNEDWNTYDNGHTLIEIFLENLNKWILYDIDLKNVFLKKNNYLSLFDIITSDSYEVVPTSDHSFLDYSGYKKYFIHGEYIKYNKNIWYDRVFHFFSIMDPISNKFIFNVNNPSDEKKIQTYFEGKCLCLDEFSFEIFFYDR